MGIRTGLLRPFSTVSRQTVVQAQAQARIAERDALHPFSPSLIDSYHRKHDYLRISLTERCNLRCTYCMPSEGVQLSPPQSILTKEEVLRLASLFVRSGITKIRLTGGEPTIRKDIIDIVAGLNILRPLGLKSIAMTSNGLALHRRLPQLIENGLTHLNLSLDTLDPFKFELVTRRRGHDAVLRTLSAALSSPDLKGVKLNVVVMKGFNDQEVLDFVALTKDQNLSVRFIEFMPFTGNRWDKEKMLPSAELLDMIQARYKDITRLSDEVNDTAKSWKVAGFRGSFGFISSMSDHFCSTCNRLRITADGQIKVCLFDAEEVSLRDHMRNGASDQELLNVVKQALGDKKEKHEHMENIDVVKNRPMILIGGARTVMFPNLYTFAPFQNKRPIFRQNFQTMGARSRLFSSTSKNFDSKLTHIDGTGRPHMVDISSKPISHRTATARGKIYIPKHTYDMLVPNYKPTTAAQEKSRRKGDVLNVAQLAAIMGAKKTSDLIPLCHSITLNKVHVNLTPVREKVSTESDNGRPDGRTERYCVLCEATTTSDGKTGVEMEALTAVTVGLLTVWDMLKAVAGREMEIGQIMVTSKEGGQSGAFSREFT